MKQQRCCFLIKILFIKYHFLNLNKTVLNLDWLFLSNTHVGLYVRYWSHHNWFPVTPWHRGRSAVLSCKQSLVGWTHKDRKSGIWGLNQEHGHLSLSSNLIQHPILYNSLWCHNMVLFTQGSLNSTNMCCSSRGLCNIYHPGIAQVTDTPGLRESNEGKHTFYKNESIEYWIRPMTSHTRFKILNRYTTVLPLHFVWLKENLYQIKSVTSEKYIYVIQI